jgi:ABC-2 type transport system permease protein
MSTDQSVIHDIGYQRYDGPRLGRAHGVRSLYTHGVRTAFGLGRPGKAKVFPWAIVSLIVLVAAVIVIIRSQGGGIVKYPDYLDGLTPLLILMCAIAAPELVSRDLRAGVLPLYFSRPLRRSDYALAKLAALATAVFLPMAGGLLLMFVGSAFTVDGFGAVLDELWDVLPAVGYAAVYAIVFASVALPVASLAGRRAVAAACIVGTFLVTTPIVGVLYAVGGETVQQLASLASPMTLVGGIGDWLFEPTGDVGIGDFGPLYAGAAVALVGICVLLLLARYRRVAR